MTSPEFRQTWPSIVTTFIKLGVTPYGGPAIMGIMQSELQEKRQWVGYARDGWWGGLLAGVCFVLRRSSSSWVSPLPMRDWASPSGARRALVLAAGAAIGTPLGIAAILVLAGAAGLERPSDRHRSRRGMSGRASGGANNAEDS